MRNTKETKNHSANPGDFVGICSHLKAWISMVVAFLNNSKLENNKNRAYNSRNQNLNSRVNMWESIFVYTSLAFVN